MSDEQTPKPTNFVSYLIEQALSDPRTRALIGTALRWVLTMAGTALAAHPVGRMLSGAASNADWITMAAGAVVGVLTLIWGMWQKFKADKVLKKAIAAPAVLPPPSAPGPNPVYSLPPVSEIKP